MKKIRILFLTSLLLSITTVVFAQNKDKSWTFTAGFNVVDIRVPTDFKGIAKDYLNGNIEYLNFSGVPIQLTAEKYMDKGNTTWGIKAKEYWGIFYYLLQ